MSNLRLGDRFLALAMAGALALCTSGIENDNTKGFAFIPGIQARAEETQDTADLDEREEIKTGLAGLLSANGIDVENYQPIVLDVEGWERGFVEAFSYYSKYMPSMKQDAGTRLAAQYFLANHSHTDLSIIGELADRNYISENNNVDLKELVPDDPNTDANEAQTEFVDPDGIANVQNAIMFYNEYNDYMERTIHTDWLLLQENGGGRLDPKNYPDPSIMIQDPQEREIVHKWFEAYVRGYDLTPGTFEDNEDMQFVYRAFGSLNSERDEVSIQYLKPDTEAYVRLTLYEWLQAYVEDYMYENYRFTLRDDPEYRIFDVNELENNQRFVLLDPEHTKPRLGECLNELDLAINAWLELNNSRQNIAINCLMGEVLGQKVIRLNQSEALENNGTAKTLGN